MRRWRPARTRPVPLLAQVTVPPGGSALGARLPVAPSADGLMPQALGLETRGGVFTALIGRGTSLPARRSEIFTTADDNQTCITITLLQGDDPRAAGNTAVGIVELTGLAPEPRGRPQIGVSFDVDSAMLTVSAIDLLTGAEVPVTVSGQSTPGPIP